MILLIDNYDSFTYNIYQLVAQTGYPVQVVRNDQITLSEIEALNPSHLILSPGPGRPEDAGICVEAIKHFASDIPILGICLGHQAIAIAFGGQVVSAERIMHGKNSFIFHSRKNLFKGMPLPFKAGRYHSLTIERSTFPDMLQIEAETENGVIMAIKHKTYPCFGLQFHPESILTPEGKHLIDQFLLEEGALCLKN
jgi:anthranilate synthase/aminodeoxychorismate synthase-like glutamine amidotransferase